MAKLIEHFFDLRSGNYSIFEIDGLKETSKQYTKISDFKIESKNHFWTILSKDQLGKLSELYGDKFCMYGTEENKENFIKIIIERFEQKVKMKQDEYNKAVQLLEEAKTKLKVNETKL